MNKPAWLIIHHTGVSYNENSDQFLATNKYHKQLWDFPSSLSIYAGYHYEISKSGKITQCRLDTDEGAHCVGMNLSSIGVALDGNFDFELPTQEQKNALRGLLEELTAKWNIPISRIVPHRHFAQKSCFGSKLPDDWASTLSLKLNISEKQVSLLQRLIALYQELLASLQAQKARKLSGREDNYI